MGLPNWFVPSCRSDQLVLQLLLWQWLDFSFPTTGIPLRHFKTDITIFLPIWSVIRFWELCPIQTARSTSTVWSSRHCITGLAVQPGPPGYDCHGQIYGSVLYKQAGGGGGDRVPLPTSFNYGPVSAVTGHSSLGQTHYRLMQCDHRPPV